jgi:hypothetical protein
MDHAVTVGAKQTKISGLRFVVWFQRVNGLGVMTFIAPVDCCDNLALLRLLNFIPG